MKSIMDYWAFPNFTPRKNQIEALEWLQQQKAKYLILELPVGSGKSAIGLTYSQYLGSRRSDIRGDSYILTPQRILQTQYEQSVKGNKLINMTSFYGKSNYQCNSKNTTCDIGSLIKPACSSCKHTLAKKAAQQAADTVLNYKLALTSFAYTKTFKRRKLIIMDECHTLEQHLIDFDAIRITQYTCKRYDIDFKKQSNIQQAINWTRKVYLPGIEKQVNKLEHQCEDILDKHKDDLTKTDIQKLRELSKLLEHIQEVISLTTMDSKELVDQFVLVYDDTMFQFKRLYGHYAFNKVVKPYGERFLFMSSTILNKQGFCEDLGIPEEDTAFLSLPSEFDTNNRPVFYLPSARMNAKWNQPEQEEDRKKMIKAVDTLCSIHHNESGIIHTGNFKISQWLIENVTTNHKIFHHNPDSEQDRNDVINAFTECSKPSLLISPSITEGLDLKDDLGRFAIFCKIPYGFLGDQWIKRRMELSNEWYQRRALIDIIQGGGRIVRSETDWGKVYILDLSWGYLYKQTFHMIPQWWKQAYSRI